MENSWIYQTYVDFWITIANRSFHAHSRYACHIVDTESKRTKSMANLIENLNSMSKHNPRNPWQQPPFPFTKTSLIIFDFKHKRTKLTKKSTKLETDNESWTFQSIKSVFWSFCHFFQSNFFVSIFFSWLFPIFQFQTMFDKTFFCCLLFCWSGGVLEARKT